MRQQDIGQQVCSLARTMAIIGDAWTMMIIRDAFFGLRRFSDFQKSLDINKNRLSERLNKLIDHGILEKRLYDEARQYFEYRLTDKGKDLYPVLISLVGWGDKHTADKDGRPLEYIHKGCGEVMSPQLHCDQCHEPIGAKDVRVQAGPGINKKLERNEPIHRVLNAP